MLDLALATAATLVGLAALLAAGAYAYYATGARQRAFSEAWRAAEEARLLKFEADEWADSLAATTKPTVH